MRGEKECLPCLHNECVLIHKKFAKNVKESKYCEICGDSLGSMPCLQLSCCNNVKHYNCMAETIKGK